MTPAFAELLRNNPAINNVIEFARDEWATPWRAAPYVSAARLIAKLRAAEYDLVIDLQGQLRSAVFAFASGAPVRIGFDKPRADRWQTLVAQIPDEAKKHAWQGAREGSFLAYTHHLALPTLDLHPVERYLRIAPLLGFDDARPISRFRFRRKQPPASTGCSTITTSPAKPLVAIAPGTNWDTKQWRSEGFAEVARHFLQNGMRRGFDRLGPRARVLRRGGAACAGRRQSRRRNDTDRARSPDPPRGDLRHQRFRADASGRRARPAGGRACSDRPIRSGPDRIAATTPCYAPASPARRVICGG